MSNTCKNNENCPSPLSSGENKITRRKFLKSVGGTVVGLASSYFSSQLAKGKDNSNNFCKQGQFYDYTVGECKEDPLRNPNKPLLTHNTDLPLDILKYETDEYSDSFDGKIYDGHNHIWLIPETFFLQWGCNIQPQGFIRPIPINEQFDYWRFYAERLGVVGSINLSFPNPGGMIEYRPPKPKLSCSKVNIGGRAGVYHNAASIYTKAASERSGKHDTFAFASLDYRFLPKLIKRANSSKEIKNKAKIELGEQVKLLSEIGFDGLKFKQERFRSSQGPFMWGVGLDIDGLPPGFWELDEEVFMYLWKKLAEEDMAVTFHLDDSGSVQNRDKYWGEGGVLENILDNTPGLQFIVAHGYGPLSSGGLQYRKAFDQNGHDKNGECQKGWDQLTRLIEKFDGSNGAGELFVDFILESFMFMADKLHNTHDRGRNWVMKHSNSIFIGVDTISAAARDYQSGGKRHEVENRYFRMRKLLETNRSVKKWTGSSLQGVERGLDLPNSTLDKLYRENVLSIVDQGNNPINTSLAVDYVEELVREINSGARGYEVTKDPMVEDLRRTARFLERA